ncbi:hypothetical protein Pst134EA_025536 [Puccinia striiformis f. sp. tritici]|uniref:hypothetical protein n=1 Tax=Puccinia striiformis f. sp. tritici TaxID=168172 RepID=UPI002007DBB2|nr:hypothetical protein Pst134EA_025536 [Puccinia striiformis f. sp. tritici]KAH9451589.1 hypothetical protein Pst134EA_025536 [Puccinia striiformis f. sp. tritici]
MSTRSAAGSLLPLGDPDALIRAASAARRKAKIQAALQDQNPISPQNLTLSNSTLCDLPALPPSPTMADSPAINTTSDDSQKIVQPSDLAGAEQERRKADTIQRQADADRIARLEESILLLSVKREPTEQSVSREATRTESGRLDLQRFRIDGPYYIDTSHAVEPFITWIEGVEIAFTTKGITRDDDKICVVGLLIREGRTHRFYAQGITKFLEGTWAAFKAKLLAFTLPPSGIPTFKKSSAT